MIRKAKSDFANDLMTSLSSLHEKVDKPVEVKLVVDEQLKSLLQELKLDSLQSYLTDQAIDYEMLMNCDNEEALVQLGIDKYGHIMKLLPAIRQRRENYKPKSCLL